MVKSFSHARFRAERKENAMKWTKMMIQTLREDPGDAEIDSHKLLVRAALVKQTAAGLFTFLPLGMRALRKVEAIVREEMNRAGAQELLMPILQPAELWQTTGRWETMGANMFKLKDRAQHDFALGPTAEEEVTDVVKSVVSSYRQLPLRIGEIAHDFRYESSGTLKGIERGRHFCQNDAHLFCTPEQIKDEVAAVCDLIFDVYRDFGITDYRCVLSLRDPADKKKYHQDDAMWDHAESALREVLTELGIHFTEEIGEAAFYGPKLDVNVKPAVGAEYTLSTCQLDFCLPAKFDLRYIDRDGTEKCPVVIHRAILGSLDRFMAYLIEETKGRFPTWLAPVQVKVLPVSEKTLDYARAVTEELEKAGLRVVLDESNEKIGYKIRLAQQEDRVPYMLVIGAREAEENTVAVRTRAGEDLGAMPLADFMAKLDEEIRTRAR